MILNGKRFDLDAAISVLLACAIIAGGCTALAEGLLIEQADNDVAGLPTPFKILSVLTLGSASLCGLLALGRIDLRTVAVPALAWVAILAWWSIRWAEHIPDRFDPYRFLIGPKGMGVWLCSACMFAAMDQRRWPLMGRCLMTVAALAFAVAAAGLPAALAAGSRLELIRMFNAPISVLLWTAPFLLIATPPVEDRHAGLWRAAAFGMFAMTLFAALMTATRSLLLLGTLTGLCAFGINTWLDRARFDAKRFAVAMLSMLVAGAIAVALLQRHLDQSVGILSDRLLEDSRTLQYVRFFEQHELSELAVGNGPFAVWWWQGRWYGWIDGSFTLLLMIGGLPLLSAYLVVYILPMCTPKLRDPRREVWAARCMLFAWTLAMAGLSIYTVPKVHISHVLVSCYAGICWAATQRRRDRPLVTATDTHPHGAVATP